MDEIRKTQRDVLQKAHAGLMAVRDELEEACLFTAADRVTRVAQHVDATLERVEALIRQGDPSGGWRRDPEYTRRPHVVREPEPGDIVTDPPYLAGRQAEPS